MLSLKDVATVFGVTTNAVRKACRDGDISPSATGDHGNWYFNSDAMDKIARALGLDPFEFQDT